MKYRTDLAIERKEMLEEDGERAEGIEGVEVRKRDYGDGVRAVRIDITSEAGEKRMEKPAGSYITIEAEGIAEEREGVKEKAEEAVSEELRGLVKFHSRLRVLIAGLGNRMVTPDALGPRAASKVRVTRHMFVMLEADSDDEMSNVSCIIPGVTATTGMETAEIIKKAVEISGAELVIAIDSLAARNIERVSTTIQITDTGISPGGGMETPGQA